jgi:dTDP-4-dehydrorhamnose reductase
VTAERPLPRRAFVAGHRGMLGHVVARLLAERGVEVGTSEERYSGGPSDPLVEAARDSGAEVVVNCLGRIKQKSQDPRDLATANALFPLHLVQRLRRGQFLLHASSDCVFAGARGRYRVDDERDATDDYGRSKIIGEGVARWPDVSVIRVSIIGPERDRSTGGSGLLAWLLSRSTALPVPGYTNHLWNGITTLEWARVALELLERRAKGEAPPSIVQPSGTTVSKYELLCAIRDAFGTGHRIVPTEAPERIDRTLSPTSQRRSIEEQLRELAVWSGSEAVAC